MSTSKKQVKLWLPQELIERLHALHSSYGEAGRVMQQLIRDYVEREEQRRETTKVR